MMGEPGPSDPSQVRPCVQTRLYDDDIITIITITVLKANSRVRICAVSTDVAAGRLFINLNKSFVRQPKTTCSEAFIDFYDTEMDEKMFKKLISYTTLSSKMSYRRDRLMIVVRDPRCSRISRTRTRKLCISPYSFRLLATLPAAEKYVRKSAIFRFP